MVARLGMRALVAEPLLVEAEISLGVLAAERELLEIRDIRPLLRKHERIAGAAGCEEEEGGCEKERDGFGCHGRRQKDEGRRMKVKGKRMKVEVRKSK
jgi:hypothetical protein